MSSRMKPFTGKRESQLLNELLSFARYAAEQYDKRVEKVTKDILILVDEESPDEGKIEYQRSLASYYKNCGNRYRSMVSNLLKQLEIVNRTLDEPLMYSAASQRDAVKTFFRDLAW